MPTHNYGRTLSQSELTGLTENWLRCKTEHVQELFFVYDASQHRTERISSFRLQGNAVSDLLTAANNFGSGDYNLYVRLVLEDGYLGLNQIPDQPFFYLAVQILPAQGNSRINYACLPEWDPNPVFSQSARESTDSGNDQLPGAGAYLFAENWLSTPENELAGSFELTAEHQDRRVHAYRVSKAESRDIVNSLIGFGNDAQLSIHMGRSFVVPSHPVAFRPVLETSDGTTGQADNAYFDFAAPIPPNPVSGGS